MSSTESTLADPTAAGMIDAEVLDDVLHAIDLHSDVLMTWDYERSRQALSKLYEKAKTSQWNGNDLPWDTDVDVEKLAASQRRAALRVLSERRLARAAGAPRSGRRSRSSSRSSRCRSSCTASRARWSAPG